MQEAKIIQSIEIAGYAREKIVPEVLQSIKPDIIYILAGTISHQQTESIFSRPISHAELPNNFTLLILVNDLHNRHICDLQETIEQRCKGTADILTIVLETQTFIQSLQASQPFFITIVRAATVIYNQIDLPTLSMAGTNTALNPAEIEACYAAAINKAKEFLAGADLFRLRKQYKMAAFMIHQSIEQALLAILKAGTGYYPNTHNIDRLIRFASLAAPHLMGLFSQRSEVDKRLYRLLDNAYIDTRYKQDFTINGSDIELLAGKARLVQQIVAATYKELIH